MFSHILYDRHYSKLGVSHSDLNRKKSYPWVSRQWHVGWQVLWWGEVRTEWRWAWRVWEVRKDLEEEYAPLVGNLEWEWILLLNKAIWITFPSKWMIPCVQMVEKLNGKAFGSVMILVTSGDDEHVTNCFLTVLSSGSTIHTIALGSSAVKNLEELSHLTGR